MAIQVTKQVQKNSFISYVLSDQVWYNIKRFLSYSKNYIFKFMQANLWHHELYHFHLPFWIWKVWRGREKITEVWISQERKKLQYHSSVGERLNYSITITDLWLLWTILKQVWAGLKNCLQKYDWLFLHQSLILLF